MSRPADIEPPRAILFDWDNTLVDTWPTIIECYNATFKALGQTPWTAAGGARSRARLAARRLSPSCSATRRARRRRSSTRPSTASISSGSSRCRAPMSLLARCRVVGLLCRGGEQQGRRQSAHRGRPSRLGPWISQGGRRHATRLRDKPAPDPIYLALDGTGIAPDDDVWMVGDTPADLKCAHAAGCLAGLLRQRGDHDGTASGLSRRAFMHGIVMQLGGIALT